MEQSEESVNVRCEGHWLSSPLQDMAVRVHGNMAEVWDGERGPYRISKTEGSWPKPKSDRGRVALYMIGYIERSMEKLLTLDN